MGGSTGTASCIVGVIKHNSLDIKKPTKVICILHARGRARQCKNGTEAFLLPNGAFYTYVFENTGDEESEKLNTIRT